MFKAIRLGSEIEEAQQEENIIKTGQTKASPEFSGGIAIENSGGITPENSGGITPENSGGITSEDFGGIAREIARKIAHEELRKRTMAKSIKAHPSTFGRKMRIPESTIFKDGLLKTTVKVQNFLAEDRGDVPGWVLVVLMTTGLVTGIWTVAEPRLSSILKNSLDNMNSIR
jgi:hypothetical protein